MKSAKAKIFPEGALGYFVGPTLALLSNSILSGYLNKYMTDVLNMTNDWAKDFLTWLPIISVIFVVLGNIVVGRLMDHSKTRAGKARPILLLSAVLSVVALIVLFIATPFNTAESPTSIITLVVFAIGYNLWFAVAYPFYYTPHSSLVTLSTRNSTDRSLLATISNATALAAMGLTSMILPFFMGLLFVDNGNGGIDPQKSYHNWQIFVIALMVITFIGTIIEYYFTRERITEESFSLQQGDGAKQKKAVPLSKQAKVCLKDKYWWIIICFFFLYQLGGMLKNCSQIYYCQSWFTIDGEYSATIGGTFQGTLSIIGAIPTAVGMLLVWPLANKIGKGKSILFGAFISVIGGAIGFIDPSNFALVTTSFVIKALGSTPAMYISLALMADMLDHEEAVYGIRTDGLTMTVYGAIMAGMTGIANGIINAVLVAAGYNSKKITQNLGNVQQATLWTFIGGETICYACIAILFFFMNVEKFSKIDHETIVADQKAVAEAKGITYVSAEETLKLQEEESKRMSRENDLNELKARCEKKGLNYENELAAYEAKEAEKAKSAAEKKAYADAKKAEKKAKADAKAKAKLDAMTEEQRHQAELAEKAKKDKALKREMKIEAKFVKLRSKAEPFRNSLNA